MDAEHQKNQGAYYTPEHVVRSLVKWAVRKRTDRLLDPSCGDGRFLAIHPRSVGVEQDAKAAETVHARSPGSLIHQGEFFAWAAETSERFECAAGNPPFIRYQRFTGDVRSAAQKLCSRVGADFSSLSSSWAPFIVATASLLKPGGRLAFVVPAEIGHAPYAVPLLKYLLEHFGVVHVVAVRKKLFAELSEDCWLLYCDGFGAQATSIRLTQLDDFGYCDSPPREGQTVALNEWRRWNHRLRPFLLPSATRALYHSLLEDRSTYRLDEVAKVGIGYVTGANDFFHLRPSVAKLWGIEREYLFPAVRSGKCMRESAMTLAQIQQWRSNDEPNFLLRLKSDTSLSAGVREYLASAAGNAARETYKCRNRKPWFVVPDVHVPDAFLSYMSGERPSLALNLAGCVGTNSVHVIRMRPGANVAALHKNWGAPLTSLSCELEGHPLGGGMLKVEPREASQIALRRRKIADKTAECLLEEGIELMRRWRHYGN